MASVLSFDGIDAADIARFWIWVEKSDSCWEWVGRRDKHGYGRANTSVGGRFAHRLSWFIKHGSISDLTIDHACHNTSCVNPDHLRPATTKQNAENLLPVRAASGYRGVYRSRNKWCAAVNHNGVRHNLGSFDTPEEANAAVTALRNELFTHNLLDR